MIEWLKEKIPTDPMVPNVKPIMTDVQSTGDNNITITFQVSYKTSAVRYRSKVRINFHRIVFIAKSVRLILSHRLYMWPCINPLKFAINYFDDYIPLSWFQHSNNRSRKKS